MLDEYVVYDNFSSASENGASFLCAQSSISDIKDIKGRELLWLVNSVHTKNLDRIQEKKGECGPQTRPVTTAILGKLLNTSSISLIRTI